MDVQHWIGLLGAADDRTWTNAQNELVAAGKDAVQPLLRVLHEDSTPRAEQACVTVLQQLGLFAARGLVETLASLRSSGVVSEDADRVARRACRALGVPEVGQALYYAQRLTSERIPERRNTADVMSVCGELEFAPLLVPALADTDESVTESAVQSFGRFGPAAIPLLQRVRRSPAPERRGALAALAQVDWRAIEPADVMAIHRLIMRKLQAETPRPYPIPDGFEWYAVPTEDQAAVLDAFELSDPVPATMAMGSSVSGCGLRYVSPAFDGWTLVFGPPVPACRLDDHRRMHELDHAHGDDELMALARLTMSLNEPEPYCVELSRRFGEAHWYKEIGEGSYDSGGWCIAVDGKNIRYISQDAHELTDLSESDRLHHAEEGLRGESVSDWLAANGFPADMWDDIFGEILGDHMFQRLEAPFDDAVADRWDEFARRTGIPARRSACTVAERASVGPHMLGPATRVIGHGVLAHTICGRERHHGGAIVI
ncbi:HEAT repeat domain-containing protein [Nocardia tengchongensis]|uniref:HEAT repeat domain-containing protein n=1 Tax=Nocardia tengchongensis TaxID=2055889 RepID=UPI00360FDFAA